MTELTPGKSVTRSMPALHSDCAKTKRAIVSLEVDDRGKSWVIIRGKGRKTDYRVQLETLYDFAVKKGL